MKHKLLIVTIIFILLEGFILSHNANAAMTFQQAKNVWNKLGNASGYHILLKLDPDTESNAYCTPHKVFITQGMLNDVDNEDQLAFGLGHELGHYVKQHYRKQQSMNAELEADTVGYYYCKQRLKYKKCMSFLTKMRHLYGEEGQDGIHPSWSKRMENLK